MLWLAKCNVNRTPELQRTAWDKHEHPCGADVAISGISKGERYVPMMPSASLGPSYSAGFALFPSLKIYRQTSCWGQTKVGYDLCRKGLRPFRQFSAKQQELSAQRLNLSRIVALFEHNMLTFSVGKPLTPNSSANFLFSSSVASTLAKVMPCSLRGPEALAYSGSSRLQCPHLHSVVRLDHEAAADQSRT